MKCDHRWWNDGRLFFTCLSEEALRRLNYPRRFFGLLPVHGWRWVLVPMVDLPKIGANTVEMRTNGKNFTIVLSCSNEHCGRQRTEGLDLSEAQRNMMEARLREAFWRRQETFEAPTREGVEELFREAGWLFPAGSFTLPGLPLKPLCPWCAGPKS